MILILSTDGDLSTDSVIDWLIFYSCNYYRINDNDILTKSFSFSFNKKNCFLKIGDETIDLSSVKVVWFRKFGFFRKSIVYNYLSKANNLSNSQKLRHLSSEYNTIRELLLSILKDKLWLADPISVNLNKIDVLIKATKLNLKTPYTLVTNESKNIHKVIKKNKKIITKPLSEAMFFESLSRKDYSTYTARVDECNLKNISSFFFPSLIQEEIEKEFEIRTFYLTGAMYSMAIFSQNNYKTEVDFRKYDTTKPNRKVPYQLSKTIENKIDKLMKILNLNTGSIDLIKTHDGDYIFLEVNPAGQFGMVEEPCNYTLHKDVAKELVKMYKK